MVKVFEENVLSCFFIFRVACPQVCTLQGFIQSRINNEYIVYLLCLFSIVVSLQKTFAKCNFNVVKMCSKRLVIIITSLN